MWWNLSFQPHRILLCFLGQVAMHDSVYIYNNSRFVTCCRARKCTGPNGTADLVVTRILKLCLSALIPFTAIVHLPFGLLPPCEEGEQLSISWSLLWTQEFQLLGCTMMLFGLLINNPRGITNFRIVERSCDSCWVFGRLLGLSR